MVGRSPHLLWLCSLLLDRHTDLVLYQRKSYLPTAFCPSLLILSQTWNMAYFPLSSGNPYDRFGNIYNVSAVLDASNRFNLTAYLDYSPLYLPATYAMTYMLAFGLSTCVLVHTILYHGRSLLNGVKKIRVEQDDIHAKLMRNYPEVPDWWYVICFVGFFFLMVVVAEVSFTCQSGRFVYRLSAGVAYIGAYMGLAVVCGVANSICPAIWVHLRNDWARGMCASALHLRIGTLTVRSL